MKTALASFFFCLFVWGWPHTLPANAKLASFFFCLFVCTVCSASEPLPPTSVPNDSRTPGDTRSPFLIDLTSPVPPVTATPLEGGTAVDPQGHRISFDSRSFFMDGVPWIPVIGEFQLSRYPRAEWREELLKMKAGGVEVVGTYLFWNHVEEEQGLADWSGNRSLREFLELIKEAGLKAFVRIGPWVHGEARNGGFPDWVQNAKVKLRSTDPAYLAMVEPYYKQVAQQMKGLLWKDGGPVIGIQLDNEGRDPSYLLKLKEMARGDGMDVPFYAMTGWAVTIPKAGLLPMFGGYVCPFWDTSLRGSAKLFHYSQIRNDCDMGDKLEVTAPEHHESLQKFPYCDVEEGVGMQSSYTGRTKIDPDDSAAMMLVRTGSGVNMRGYFTYHGGIHPDGKFSTMHEAHPQPMPVKDYDFQTAIGSCGQVRRSYFLMREQHLFLRAFGTQLARMPAYFPETTPSSTTDADTLRWAVRSDGTTSFLFFNNRQPIVPLPDRREVQFQLKTASGNKLIPNHPITIPSGCFGVLPVNLDCHGVPLEYATAQPVCRVAVGNHTTYFFTEISGIAPEFLFAPSAQITVSAGKKEKTHNGVFVHGIVPGTGAAIHAKSSNGKTVDFVVLTAAQGRQLARLSFAGQDRLVLSDAVAFQDGEVLKLQSTDPHRSRLSIFPKLNAIVFGGKTVKASTDGVFASFTPASAPVIKEPVVKVTLEHPAGPDAATLKGTDENTWADAAVYTLNIPASAAGKHTVLDIHYVGDAARLYVGDTLHMDNYFNGDPMPIALWRIPQSDWPKIRLKVLPYSDALLHRLPVFGKQVATQAKSDNTLDRVTVTATTRVETIVAPTGSKF